MAEFPPRGSQPRKRQQPSRLRHEVNPDWIEDEIDLGDQSVQVVDSQIVVPETQLEYPEDIRRGATGGMDDDEPLSPSSAAMLDKNAVKKGPEKSAPSPFQIKLFSKDAFSQPEVPFSFASQARKAPSIAPSQTKPTSSQPAVEARPSLGSLSIAPSKPADSDNVVPSKPEVPTAADGDEVSQLRPDAQRPSEENAHHPVQSTLVVPADSMTPVSTGDELRDANRDMPPSAQPRSGVEGGEKKVKTGKKKKKGKKLPLLQHRGAPWPPRPSGTFPDPVLEHPRHIETTHLDEALPLSSLPTAITGDREVQSVVADAEQVVIHSEPLDEHNLHASQAPPDDSNASARLGTQECHAPELVVPDTYGTVDVMPEQSLTHAANLPTSFPPEEPKLPIRSSIEADAISHVPHESRASPEAHVAVHAPLQHGTRERQTMARPKSRHAHVQQPQQTIHDQLDLAEPEVPSLPEFKSPARKEDRPHKQAEAFLHDTSSRGGLYRVEKPPKRKRIASGPQPMTVSAMARNRGPAVQSGFEQTLESLRVAHIMEQSRIDHDRTTQEKNFEEVKALLQDQINQYSVTAAEWKDRHDSLNGNVVQLREKVKTNQKYVTGLQKDYEKLQKSAMSHRDECKNVLQQKIAEVESEKETLRRELELTLDTVTKGQRNLKQTVDELYVRLFISESKRKDLAENMSKQMAMFEEEKSKRNDLEKQLLTSVQSVQRQLGDRSTQLVEKIESLQATVESVKADDKPDSSAQECLVALKELQSTPFLTTKDLHKAEGMLRFVHEGIGTKLDALVQSVENKTYPTEDIQTFVKGQLQELRSEMLRFDEVVAESRKAQESNDALQQKVEAEQQHGQLLTEQIRALHQNEKDLKARQTQLEQQLSDINDQVRVHDAEPSALEKEMGELRQQLRTVEDERAVKEVQIARLERNLEKRDRKLADFEKSYNPLKDRCEKLAAKLKESTKPSDDAEIRKGMLKELQQEFLDKEVGYKNDIHRLTVECDEMKALIQQHEEKSDATKACDEDASRQVAEIRSELEAVRKEKIEAEGRATTAERAAHDAASNSSEIASNSSEIASLKERLQKKAEELQSKVEDYTELERAVAQLESRHTDLKLLCEQQQAEITEHPSKIDSLRSELQSENSLDKESAQAAVQRARKEKEEVEAKLEEAETEKSRLSNIETTLTNELEDLGFQNAELRSAKESSEAQVVQIREEKAKEIRRYEEDLDTLRREQERSNTALKEAEARIRRQDAEYHKKIEFDREKYTARVQSLVEELEEAKAAASSNQRQQTSQSSVEQQTLSGSLQNIHAEKHRKKVDREAPLVPNAASTSGTHVDRNTQHSVVAQRQDTRKHNRGPAHDSNLFDERSSNSDLEKLTDDHSQSILEAPAEQIDDAQDISHIVFSNDDFEERIGHKPLKGSQNRLSDATDQSPLSRIPTDELEQLGQDVQKSRRISTPASCARSSGSVKQKSSQDRVVETPTRSDSRSLSLSESQDRPRSQANTASRMMPPPGNTSRHFEKEKLISDSKRKSAAYPQGYDKTGTASKRNQGSSPDYMHHPSSASKHTYAHHSPETRVRSEQIRDASRSHDQAYSQKRKSSVEQDASYKKQRTSSQSLPSSSSRSGTQSSAQYPIRSSAAGVRSKTKRAPLQPPSSSGFIRPASRNHTSTVPSQSRGQQSSASRSSAGSRGSRFIMPGQQSTSARRTRSQSVADERFQQEMHGL